jgi:hypothetical protein
VIFSPKSKTLHSEEAEEEENITRIKPAPKFQEMLPILLHQILDRPLPFLDRP